MSIATIAIWWDASYYWPAYLWAGFSARSNSLDSDLKKGDTLVGSKFGRISCTYEYPNMHTAPACRVAEFLYITMSILKNLTAQPVLGMTMISSLLLAAVQSDNGIPRNHRSNVRELCSSFEAPYTEKYVVKIVKVQDVKTMSTRLSADLRHDHGLY